MSTKCHTLAELLLETMFVYVGMRFYVTCRAQSRLPYRYVIISSVLHNIVKGESTSDFDFYTVQEIR